jgi:hypothetical protein
MKVNGQLHAPAALTLIKITLFTLGSRLGGHQKHFGPFQDSICDCWVGERRRLLSFSLCNTCCGGRRGKGKYNFLFQQTACELLQSRNCTVAVALNPAESLGVLPAATGTQHRSNYRSGVSSVYIVPNFTYREQCCT